MQESNDNNVVKERFSTRLGFILVSAGCAIGLGNVWRFPYIVGKNGGAIFVIFYLIFLAIIGIPIMTVEFSVGRASNVSPAKCFSRLMGRKTKWSILSFTSILGNFTIMTFYTGITGWMFIYMIKMLRGDFVGNNVNTALSFSQMLANPIEMLIATAFVIALGFLICLRGFNKGVESITKFMMTALLALIVVLSIKSLSLKGALEGIKFYLVPNWHNVKEVGIVTVIFEAMNQAFFTLSIGIGSMAIFGSRIDKEHRLPGESLRIALLDTFVAIMSGLIIFPACASFNIKTDVGAGLIFVTLPNIFNKMIGGRLWGTLFFLFLTFAAMSTVVAVFEMIITCVGEIFNFTRKKSILVCLIVVMITAIPAILGFNIWKGFTPLNKGNILEWEDFLVSANLLPLGSLGYLLFCMLSSGWGFDSFITEADTGNKGMKFPKSIRKYMTFILPIIILIIFAMGYYNKFFKVIS